MLVLDRSDFPRDKVCGDGIAPEALDVLTGLGVDTALLTGCAGDNTDVQRGETNCDAGSDNSHDEDCTQTGTPNPSENT